MIKSRKQKQKERKTEKYEKQRAEIKKSKKNLRRKLKIERNTKNNPQNMSFLIELACTTVSLSSV